MRRASIHGLPPKEPEPYPVFEIMGVPDCGKKLVAELVARRIAGSCVFMPLFDFQSFTGRALAHSLAHQPRSLEAEPRWWAHIYAANMLEQHHRIEEKRALGPVVVTNYVGAFKVWARAAGVPKLEGFFGPLPEPLRAYSLYGVHWETPGNLKSDFSPEFLERLRKGMLRPPGSKFSLVKMEQNAPSKMWMSINKAAMDVTKDISERYGLHVDQGQLYTPSLTPSPRRAKR